MSLEVLVLALGQMTQPGGFAAALPLTHRTAIASAASLLDEASKLAYRLTAAQNYPGQAPPPHALSPACSLRAICLRGGLFSATGSFLLALLHPERRRPAARPLDGDSIHDQRCAHPLRRAALFAPRPRPLHRRARELRCGVPRLPSLQARAAKAQVRNSPRADGRPARPAEGRSLLVRRAAACSLTHSLTHSPTHLLTHQHTTYLSHTRPSVISALTRTSTPTPNVHPNQGGGMADQGTSWQQLNAGAADVPAATRFPCGGLIRSGMLRHPMASPAAPPAALSSASSFQHQRLPCTLRVPCHRLCYAATSSAAPHPSCTRLATQGRTGGWRGTVRVTTDQPSASCCRMPH